MPKLTLPTDDALDKALDAMWTSVDGDYIECHLQACKWSNKSIEASRRYSADARRRATPILKWLKWFCQNNGIYYYVNSIHLIDHSKNPPQVAPCFVITLNHPKVPAFSVKVNIYQPKCAADVTDKIKVAVEMCLYATDLKARRPDTRV